MLHADHFIMGLWILYILSIECQVFMPQKISADQQEWMQNVTEEFERMSETEFVEGK